jgi:hypothetical protein
MTNNIQTRGNLRLVLWLVLAVSLAGNVVTSSSGALLVSIPLGLVAVASGVALAVHHYRRR